MKFKKEIEGELIEGKTKKEFIFNYCKILQDRYKNLDAIDRLVKYVDYFVDNFSYDINLRETILGEENVDSSQNQEDRLFNMFYNHVGVCDQFAKGLSLLSVIDKLYLKGIICEYATTRLMVLENGKEREVGHAVVLLSAGKQRYVIDISSMIHANQGDYKQDKNSFFVKSLTDYKYSLEKENIKQVTDEEGYAYALIHCEVDENKYYDTLCMTSAQINEQKHPFGVKIEQNIASV